MAKPDERRLRICGKYRGSSSKEVPELRLVGNWFEELGFGIGDRVSNVSNGRIIFKFLIYRCLNQGIFKKDQ